MLTHRDRIPKLQLRVPLPNHNPIKFILFTTHQTTLTSPQSPVVQCLPKRASAVAAMPINFKTSRNTRSPRTRISSRHTDHSKMTSTPVSKSPARQQTINHSQQLLSARTVCLTIILVLGSTSMTIPSLQVGKSLNSPPPITSSKANLPHSHFHRLRSSTSPIIKHQTVESLM